MPENTVNTETEQVDVPSTTTISIAWKPLLKKVAALTGAALVGAGLYAVVTREVEDDDSYDSSDENLGE